MPTCNKHKGITGSGVDDSFLCVFCEIDRLRAELAEVRTRREETVAMCEQLRIENERLMSECDKWKMLTYKAMVQFRHKRIPNNPYGKIPSECTTWYDGCNCIVPYEDYSGEDYQKAKQAIVEKKP